MNLNNLFNPKSIAIVGASGERGKIGNVIAKNILNLGYKGKVFFVNPKRKKILGKDCYKDVLEIKEKIDLAVVVIPAKFVNGVVEKSANKIKNFVIISAGFSEIGEGGKKREGELKKIVERKKINILGPNCLGFIDPKLKLNASFAGDMPNSGNICFISQSGALAVALMDIAKKENMGFSQVISVGNKMSLDEGDLLEYFAKNENVKVLGLYLEGIKDGKEFIKKTQKISKIKPIVVLKAGKTERAQKTIASHTGALAGSDDIMQAAFKKSGIIVADNLEEFFEILNFISFVASFEKEEIAVITNAGGPGVLATDAFYKKEIKLAEIDEKIKNKLKKFLPIESSLQNPIDLLGDAMEDRYEKTLKEISQQKNIGIILLILTPQDQTPVGKIAEKIINFKKRNKKIQVLTSFIGGNRTQKAIALLKKNEIPNFSFPEQAIKTLEKYLKWKKSRRYLIKFEGIFSRNEERIEETKEIIKRAKKEGRSALLFSEASAIMRKYKIDIVEFWTKNTREKTVFPAVAKVDSDKILHKTDQKGLVLGIKTPESLEKAIQEMQVNFPEENIIIQPMLDRQMELIIGIKKDAIFGPVVIYGFGGIYTEIFKMVDFLILPQNKEEIKNSLMRSKINFLFIKTRNQPPYNIESISENLWNIWLLANEIDEIAGLDINPFLIYNDNKKDIGVDVKIII